MEPQNIAVKKKAALISLVIGFLMFLGKLGAYLLTGSAAVLSDAAESVVHIFATSFAFYSLHLSTKPPDTDHPYGHGKIEFFSAGFEGAFIAIAAISIIYFAVSNIITGIQISRLDVGASIIAGASIVNLFLGLYLIRVGKRTNSLVLIADGKHILTDSFTSIGAFIALILVMITEIKIIDPLFAILIALNILWTGKSLIRASVGGLMNENDEKILARIAEGLKNLHKQDNDIIDVHRLRYWKSGDKYMIDFHLIVPFYMTVEESHNLVELVEKKITASLCTDQVELFIHLDPCNPKCCHICNKPDCTERSEPKSVEIIWNSAKITASSVIDIDHTPKIKTIVN